MWSFSSIKHFVGQSVRRCIGLMDDEQASFIAAVGFPNLVDRYVDYMGFVQGTGFKIYANTKYPIEVGATRCRGLSTAHKFLTNLDLRGRTVIDVGANVGTTSLMFIHSGAAMVHAIEPGPLFDRLERNININGLNDQVIPHNFGIAMSSQWLSWHEDLKNFGNAHLLPIGTKKDFLGSLSHDTKKVLCKSLDKFCQECVKGVIHFIKVDVEGMELEVLNSGVKMLHRDKPIIFVETNKNQEEKNRSVDSFLSGLGYKKLSDIESYSNAYSDFFLTDDTLYVPQQIENTRILLSKILEY